MITQVIYAVGRVRDKFTHYVPRLGTWESAIALCGTTPIGEQWQGRSGKGRICNSCCSKASRMTPIAEVVQPQPKFLFGMGKRAS
jgi:hypothetical protein